LFAKKKENKMTIKPKGEGEEVVEEEG